jgi:hypothetical protein
MASDLMAGFVREALVAGRSRDETRAALRAAGWSEREVARALGAWADTTFLPPVPRPQPHVTARDAFVYLVLFAALGATAFSLVELVNALIDLNLGDPTEPYMRDYARSEIRWSIATLVVWAPVLVWLTQRTGRQIAQDPGRARAPVRQWLTYLALFVAALVFLGDMVYLLWRYLEGEAPLAFVLKSLTVAVVSGVVFLYYLRDAERNRDDR